MGNEGFFRRTEKGRTEIATRANKLGMRVRSMLIMVDNQTTRAGLLAKNTHATSEDILNTLLAEGYIETAPGTGTASVEPAPAASAAAAAPPAAGQPSASAATAAGPAAAPVEVSMQSASRYACHTLVTVLGPGADDLTALVEKCKNVEELAARLENCRNVIQAMAGKRKAEEFWAGANARLPKV